MLKKILIPVLLLLLSSCGYEAIHSKKNLVNYNFSLNKLTFVGDRDVGLKIKNKINSYTLNKKDKSFSLEISSVKDKVVLAKDTAGDATSFRSSITVNIKVIMKNNFKNNLRFVESFNYNNDADKFSLKKYEREIINNLAETVAEKLIFKLSNIQ